MTLEDIGEGGNALLCLTDQPACCRRPFTNPTGQQALGNWFFPNGTRVPSSGVGWDFHRTRGQSAVFLHRRRGGVVGVYHCMIPDRMNVNRNIYIGVYTASTGKQYKGKVIVQSLLYMYEVSMFLQRESTKLLIYYYSVVNKFCRSSSPIYVG